MKFDVVGSDDLSFPVAIEGSLTIKELFDKVQANHHHVLTSIGQGARLDFLLALRYKENHTLVPNEVISQVLSDGDRLIAIWASTISRVAPGRHKAALIKLAQHVVYANGSFFCTLGIVDSLAINSAQQGQVADSKVSAPKKSRVNEASKPSAAASSAPAPAPAAAGSDRLPAQPAGAQPSESESASEASGSSSSSVSSESSAPRRSPVLPAQLVTHTVHITSSNSESSSSSSSVSSSASSSSVSSASSGSSSNAGVASKAAVASAPPKPVTLGAQPAPPAKAPVPARAVSNAAQTARKSAPAKAASAAAPVKSAAAMPSPAAPTEKAILAQISSGVAIPSSAPKKRGARGGKNSASNKAKTAAST